MEEKKCISASAFCQAWGRTSIGGRKENQDCYGGKDFGDKVALTVCDGMGGMAGGQTASHLAVKAILTTLIDMLPTKPIEESIREAINNANESIYNTAKKEPSLRGMGTTATILVLTPEAAYLTHVGDSRIYRLRGRKKLFRTFDHSKVFDMVSLGYMTEEEARQSSFSNIITRALGIRTSVEMTVEKIPYKKGDRFILCSDGVWNTLPEPEMLKHFSEKDKAEDNVESLTDFVDNYGIEHGNSHDNLTAIIADVKKSSDFQYSFWHNLSESWKRVFNKPKKKKLYGK